MPTHAALLRGINVGGRSRVAMADLRAVVAGLGHTEVATYIQSGNVVFTPGRDGADLAGDLERAIAERLGVGPRVVVLSRDELAAIVERNPFPGEADPKHLHAVFRPDDPADEAHAALAAALERARAKGSDDEGAFVGRTLYLRTPGGLGRSVLAAQLSRLPGDAAATARNWATVTRLLAMLDAD